MVQKYFPVLVGEAQHTLMVGILIFPLMYKTQYMYDNNTPALCSNQGSAALRPQALPSLVTLPLP